MERNTITLSKYLLTKGINSPLKMQKILFFMRVEEIKNGKKEGIFFKKDKNFEAWIYGPVNTESYFFMQDFFNKKDEQEGFLLEDEQVKEIDKLYLEYFEIYSKYSSSTLVDKSHQNMAWIKARGNFGSTETCNTLMIENDDFIKFENEI